MLADERAGWEGPSFLPSKESKFCLSLWNVGYILSFFGHPNQRSAESSLGQKVGARGFGRLDAEANRATDNQGGGERGVGRSGSGLGRRGRGGWYNHPRLAKSKGGAAYGAKLKMRYKRGKNEGRYERNVHQFQYRKRCGKRAQRRELFRGDASRRRKSGVDDESKRTERRSAAWPTGEGGTGRRPFCLYRSKRWETRESPVAFPPRRRRRRKSSRNRNRSSLLCKILNALSE